MNIKLKVKSKKLRVVDRLWIPAFAGMTARARTVLSTLCSRQNSAQRTNFMRRLRRVDATFLILLALILSCESPPPSPTMDNPFDPDNPSSGGNPFALTAELTGGGIALNWQVVDFPGIDGYKIYRSENSADIYSNVLAQTDTNHYLDGNVENGHRYYYLVTAFNYSGESRSSTLVPLEISAQPYFALETDTTASKIITAEIFASGADSMRLALGMTSVWEAWEGYTPVRVCTLSADTNMQFMRLQVHYSDGNLSPAVTDSVFPRRIQPAIVIGNGSGYTNSLNMTAAVGNTGALNAQVWEGDDSSCAYIHNPVPPEMNLTLSSGEGMKVITIKLWNDFFTRYLSYNVVYDISVGISSVTHDGSGRILGYGDILHLELTADNSEENGTAFVDIFDQAGNSRPGIELMDEGGGLYTLDYIVKQGDDIDNGIVVGYFIDPAGNIAPADTAAGTVDIAFNISGMVFVPEGEFSMGNSMGNAEIDEQPVHTVRISDFWIGKYEVTNAEFAEFLNDGNNMYFHPGMEITFSGGNYTAVDSLSDKPVRFVNYFAAEAFAFREGMRLPTEAEWEKASRGTDGRNYSWGPIPAYGNICNFLNSGDPYQNSVSQTTPGGFYDGTTYGSFYTYDDASPYGAKDMLGNVSEWCSDYYSAGYYAISPYDDPENTVVSQERVLRSGSWNTPWIDIYCANRFALSPDSSSGEAGIRVAREP